MEYKKINKNGVNLHLINTNRFKTVDVVIFFTKKFDKEDIVFGNYLASSLVYTSKKYNTKNKMAIIGEELYGAKVGSSFGLSGNLESFVFSVSFLNPKYTFPDYLDKSLDFLYEVLLNPNVEDGKFNQELFDIMTKEQITSINSVKLNPNAYASNEFGKIMFKGTPCEYSTITSIEELDKVNRKNLYDFYKRLFNGEYKVDFAVLGEVDESIVDKIFKKFSIIKSSNEKLSFNIEYKTDGKLVTKIDSLDFNQSKLYMGYRLNDMDYHELYHVLRVYNTILGTMNDSILFNVVREEHSLCYSIGSYFNRYNKSLVIYAGINKTNYEETVELIKKCVESMSDKKVIESLFDYAKKTLNTYLNSYYDDLVGQINHYYYTEFDTVEDIETQRDNINKVTVDDVVKLNEKIKLSTIYMLKGDNN